MAMTTFELDFFERPAIRLWPANAVRSQVNNLVGQVLAFAPVDKRSMPDLRELAGALLGEALVWWSRLDLSRPELIGERVGDGLDLMNVAGFDAARLAARNALFLAHTYLPKPRQTPDEAERVVRLLLDRAFVALAEDATLFDPPGG